MKPKKSKKANLEKYRTIFFQIGTIIALSAILFAFEWKTSEITIEDFEDNRVKWEDTEVLPPVTMPKPEIKEIKPPSLKFIEVTDEVEVEDVDLAKLIEDIEEYKPIEVIEFEPDEEEFYDFVRVEIKPTFLGREAPYFRSYIAENVKFPEEAMGNGIAGTVFASFVIDKDGSVINAQITRKVHPAIDRAVLDVINGSPKWEPGINNGKYVKVSYNISVAFKLL